ncbi:hypothetical protein [Mesorhizobium sp. WSM4884]|uniref:DUF7946 domain-containing protein n=1 Tax=Mesorhizobium sp. WSM4884 TaxID=3038542 RepID=UPI0024161D8A|nr:hypothetical protein [Mesorhizobium sp. WSM4884]MDG4884331.1 hypothetical protein [Mesorhizobium sp. WSM4884]
MEFTLEFDGNEADRNLLDFYDAAQAFGGFQRSLALTTHLVVNGEIITQAPALKNAVILVRPPENGSWKTIAVVAGTVLLSGGVASKDSVLGHLLTSAYDYVISESLGFHVDFDKSLGQQIEEHRAVSDEVPRELDQGKFEALIEKVEPAIRELHRPISHSGTAATAILGESQSGIIIRKTGPTLDRNTFEYIDVTNLSSDQKTYTGKVSSYNSNTYKGRIYIEDEGRPVPFTLAEVSRDARAVSKIVGSLSANALDRFDQNAEIRFSALRYESKNGRLKGFLILRVF